MSVPTSPSGHAPATSTPLATAAAVPTDSASSPTSAAAPPPPPLPPPPSDPKVAELHAIFPTVELSVIELVLETCGGSVDRSIEQLLAMTDENFKPDELGGTREDSQVDLDAEFARSLQMQDEQEYQHYQQNVQTRTASQLPGQNGQGQGQGQRQGQGQLPYQPRVRRARPSHETQSDAFYQYDSFHSQNQNQRGTVQGEGNPPGMLALEDKLEKYAEVGKQTFNSLLSRAKAKYSEYQANQAQAQYQGHNQGQSQRQNSYNAGDYGSGGDYSSSARGYNPGGSRGGEQSRGLWGDMNLNSPSVRSESISSESTLDPPYQTPTQSQPIRTSSNRWQPTDSYDDPLPPRGSGVTSPNRIEVVGGRGSPSLGGRGSPNTSMGIGSPEKSTGKIDPAKLGILPKKRVDLLSTSPVRPPTLAEQVDKDNNADEDDDPNPSIPNAHHSLVSKIPQTPPAAARDDRYRLEDSDDELEYTKNPFDEK